MKEGEWVEQFRVAADENADMIDRDGDAEPMDLTKGLIVPTKPQEPDDSEGKTLSDAMSKTMESLF